MVDHSMLTNATEARGLFANKSGKEGGKNRSNDSGVGGVGSVGSGVTAANTLANTRITTTNTTNNTTAKSAMNRNRNVAFGEDTIGRYAFVVAFCSDFVVSLQACGYR